MLCVFCSFMERSFLYIVWFCLLGIEILIGLVDQSVVDELFRLSSPGGDVVVADV